MLAAAFAIAAGCGGDSDVGSLSKREYIARSNEICERHERRAEAQFATIVGPGTPTPAKAQRFLQRAAIPAIRAGLRERQALPAPTGDEDRVEAIIAAGERTVAGFERLASDRSRVAALFRGLEPDPASRYDALSEAYGIEECAGGN